MLLEHKINGLELPEMVHGVAGLSFVAAEATGKIFFNSHLSTCSCSTLFLLF